jgi:signal transduction histidine kinase
LLPGGIPVVASFLFVAILSIVVALLFAAVAAGIWRSGRWPRSDADGVDELVAAAARIQDGDYSARVPETGSAEQRLLARSFNQMSAQLGESDVRRRSFMADVSHELRTPLSVIQGQLEAIRDGVYPADAAHIAPALEQVRTLEWLVEDLRTLALSDSGTLRLARQPTDLAALVTEVTEGFRLAADVARIHLAVDVSQEMPHVPIDAARIASVIRNLVANALRHTPPNGSVTVSAAPEGPTRVMVSVTDTGRGIDPTLLPTVFERFTRAADSGGSGLGLAIAKALVEAHGGCIDATSEPPTGTTVTFHLPTEG